MSERGLQHVVEQYSADVGFVELESGFALFSGILLGETETIPVVVSDETVLSLGDVDDELVVLLRDRVDGRDVYTVEGSQESQESDSGRSARDRVDDDELVTCHECGAEMRAEDAVLLASSEDEMWWVCYGECE